MFGSLIFLPFCLYINVRIDNNKIGEKTMVSREREALENNERLKELKSRHDALVLMMEKMAEIEPQTEYEKLQKKYLRDFLRIAMKKVSGMILIEESRTQLDLLNEDFQYITEDIMPEENTATNQFVVCARYLSKDE